MFRQELPALIGTSFRHEGPPRRSPGFGSPVKHFYPPLVRVKRVFRMFSKVFRYGQLNGRDNTAPIRRRRRRRVNARRRYWPDDDHEDLARTRLPIEFNCRVRTRINVSVAGKRGTQRSTLAGWSIVSVGAFLNMRCPRLRQSFVIPKGNTKP